MKPILFNTEMVRAILEGRKTVTRRVVKTQPTYNSRDGFSYRGVAYGTDLPPIIKGAAYNLRCAAPYQVNDVLYVRETWGCYPESWGNASYFMYRADFPDGANKYMCSGVECDLPKWRPSIHMPKEAARIFLRVTGVTLERLQDINNPEAEGIKVYPILNDTEGTYYKRLFAFMELWNSTIKKDQLNTYGWDANPYVWVIEFERIPEEQAEP